MTRTDLAAAAGVLTLTLGLPYLTWLRWGYQYAGEGVREVPLFLFTAIGIIAFGLFLARWDWWLGVGVAYLAARATVYHTSLSLATVHWVAIGAVVLVAVRELPEAGATLARWGLMASGVLEVGYGCLQWWRYDPLWFGWARHEVAFVHGTFGHPTLYGAFLALLVPTAAPWLIPVFLGGVALSGSYVALMAALVGLAVRCRSSWGIRWALVTALPVLTWWTFRMVTDPAGAWRAKSLDSLGGRLGAWQTAWAGMDASWWALLFGYGPGSWYRLVPAMQIERNPAQMEVFYQAHNEALQLLFEGGLVALGLLAAWVLSHPPLWRAPGVWALGVLCLGTFPFHVAPVAATALLVLGLGLRPVGAGPPPGSWRYWA